ncbi:MAG: hypothetical protein KDC44_05750, partial [Phaeodactylibacter sp.]|nr:hypothetical protein [Phaeodactylibacter sp.]
DSVSFSTLLQMTQTFRLRWILACSFGEFIGMAIAAGLAAGHGLLFGEPASYLDKVGLLGTMILAGLLEGLVVALFQWRILRHRFKHLPARGWLRVTATAAVIAWLLGMMPSLLQAGDTAAGWDGGLSLQFFGGLMLGFFLGALFGIFQWTQLKQYADQSVQWITGNAIGWALGLAVIFIFAGSVPAGTATWLVALLGATAGLLAGLIVGTTTSFFMPPVKKHEQLTSAKAA